MSSYNICEFTNFDLPFETRKEFNELYDLIDRLHSYQISQTQFFNDMDKDNFVDLYTSSYNLTNYRICLQRLYNTEDKNRLMYYYNASDDARQKFEVNNVLISNTTEMPFAYYKISLNELFNNPNPLNEITIRKLGYICEPKAIGYPIYLGQNFVGGRDHTNEILYKDSKIYIGKTGMFEIMPETFKDINNKKITEEDNCVPSITYIKVPCLPYLTNKYNLVPAGKDCENYKIVKFKLDMVYSIN